MSTDAPKSPDATATDEPQTLATPDACGEAPEEPLVDPRLWRSYELDHHGAQYRQWDNAWHIMSERQRAAALEHIYLEILWDDLDQEQRDKAFERIQQDREWPGLYARMEAEERERREQEAEQKRAREAAAEHQLEEMGKQLAKMREQAETDATAAREREEREEREAEEERQRRAEEERERLQRERDELVAS